MPTYFVVKAKESDPLIDLLTSFLDFEIVSKEETEALLRKDGVVIRVEKSDRSCISLVNIVFAPEDFEEKKVKLQESFGDAVRSLDPDTLELRYEDIKVILTKKPEDIEYKLPGDKLLVTRRSIRYFKDKEVPEDVLWKILELCRYSPTSKNSQSYYFIIIKNKKLLKWLASLRPPSSNPIGRAPMAVAICSDPDKSKRHIQDGDIAAYHFMLAAWFFGLGTCWIAAMDRDDVKEKLGIPKHHYVATITPLGYPEFIPKPPLRKEAREFLKTVIE